MHISSLSISVQMYDIPVNATTMDDSNHLQYTNVLNSVNYTCLHYLDSFGSPVLWDMHWTEDLFTDSCWVDSGYIAKFLSES